MQLIGTRLLDSLSCEAHKYREEQLNEMRPPPLGLVCGGPGKRGASPNFLIDLGACLAGLVPQRPGLGLPQSL